MIFQSRGENRKTKIFQRMALVGVVADPLLKNVLRVYPGEESF